MASKAELLQQSELWYNRLHALTDSDEKAVTLAYGTYERVNGAPAERTRQNHAQVMRCMGLSKWRGNGNPHLPVEHLLFAGLLCTTVTATAIDDIHPPWSSFLVSLPNGGLSMRGPDSRVEIPISTLLVSVFVDHTGAEVWMLCADSPGYDGGLHHTGPKSEMWGSDTEDLVPEDKRAMLLLKRLVVGLCLSFSAKSWKQHRPTHRGNKKKRRESKEPALRNYLYVGEKIVHDMRPAVRAYMCGEKKSSSLSVQVMVAGHWKRQWYGPGSKLHRPQWIQPYWRGREDAPIIVHMSKE